MKPPCPHPVRRRSKEQGVVLVISLVMLVIISLLATFSIRNSVSSEAVSGNVRTTQLAAQAAEIALRYCEDAVVANIRTATALPTNGTSTLTILDNVEPPRAVNPANWDTVSTDVFVLPTAVLGAGTAFKRMPECMVERVPVLTPTGTLTFTTTYLVTARGFGPEVAADPARGRPNGSEVWLQSTIELEQ